MRRMDRNKTRKGTRYRDATIEELRAEEMYFTGTLSRSTEIMNEYQWALDAEDMEGKEPEAARQAFNRASKEAGIVGSFLTSLKVYLGIRASRV